MMRKYIVFSTLHKGEHDKHISIQIISYLLYYHEFNLIFNTDFKSLGYEHVKTLTESYGRGLGV